MIETINNYIPRDAYIERIRPFIGSHIIKVLTGQRRVGKSYVLYQLIDEIREAEPSANIIYVNTDLAEYRHIKNDHDLYTFVASRLEHPTEGALEASLHGSPLGGIRKNYVFVDEIQEIAGFELAIKSLFAEERCDLYCTGSNAHLLSGELATYLAGRYIQIQVHPLSYVEFLDFYGYDNTLQALQSYLRIGGMPYLASLARMIPQEPAAALPQPSAHEALAFEYLHNLYESILLRDVVARENIRNVRFLENLAAYIADNTGSLFSASNISKYLKSQKITIPVQTIINYLAALEKSFLVHKVQRADINGLKIFEIGEKYYFEDIGLRNVLARNQPMDIAKLVEQAVYLFLVQRGFTVNVGKLGAAEVDFVCERQGEKLYVQAAYHIDSEETRSREFGSLELIADNFPKYVVTMDEALSPAHVRGIRWMHVKDFLTTTL
jgi:predicted AAA+ superfamily ATPase